MSIHPHCNKASETVSIPHVYAWALYHAIRWHLGKTASACRQGTCPLLPSERGNTGVAMGEEKGNLIAPALLYGLDRSTVVESWVGCRG